jgi:GTP-binding protein EngB required for normal cell division
MECYLNEARSMHRILLLIDLNTGVTDQDKLIMDVLSDTSKPYNLILTKIDKLKSK